MRTRPGRFHGPLDQARRDDPRHPDADPQPAAGPAGPGVFPAQVRLAVPPPCPGRAQQPGQVPPQRLRPCRVGLRRGEDDHLPGTLGEQLVAAAPQPRPPGEHRGGGDGQHRARGRTPHDQGAQQQPGQPGGRSAGVGHVPAQRPARRDQQPVPGHGSMSSSASPGSGGAGAGGVRDRRGAAARRAGGATRQPSPTADRHKQPPPPRHPQPGRSATPQASPQHRNRPTSTPGKARPRSAPVPEPGAIRKTRSPPEFCQYDIASSVGNPVVSEGRVHQIANMSWLLNSQLALTVPDDRYRLGCRPGDSEDEVCVGEIRRETQYAAHPVATEDDPPPPRRDILRAPGTGSWLRRPRLASRF